MMHSRRLKLTQDFDCFLIVNLMVGAFLVFIYKYLFVENGILFLDVDLLRQLKDLNSFSEYWQKLIHGQLGGFMPIRDLSLVTDIFLLQQIGFRVYHATQLFLAFGFLAAFYVVLRDICDSRKVAIFATVLVCVHPLSVGMFGLIGSRDQILAALFMILAIREAFCKQYFLNWKSVLLIIFSFLSKPLYWPIGLIFLILYPKRTSRQKPLNQVLGYFSSILLIGLGFSLQLFESNSPVLHNLIMESNASNNSISQNAGWFLQGLGRIFYFSDTEYLNYAPNFLKSAAGLLLPILIILFLKFPKIRGLSKISEGKLRSFFSISVLPTLAPLFWPMRFEFHDAYFFLIMAISAFIISFLIFSLIESNKSLRWPLYGVIISLVFASAFKSFMNIEVLASPVLALEKAGLQMKKSQFLQKALSQSFNEPYLDSAAKERIFRELSSLEPSNGDIPYFAGRLISEKHVSNSVKLELFNKKSYCTPLWMSEKAGVYVQMKNWKDALRTYQKVLKEPGECLEYDDTKGQWNEWLGNLLCLQRLAKEKGSIEKFIHSSLDLRNIKYDLKKAKNIAEEICQKEILLMDASREQ